MQEDNHVPAPPVLGRRVFFRYLASVLATHAADASTSTGDYPSEVAGVRLPATEACKRAYRLCRRAAPDFLVNHSLRTYVFGAFYVSHPEQSDGLPVTSHSTGGMRTLA